LPVVYAQQLDNNFINDTDDRSVIASEAWQSHKIERISIMALFNSMRLPRFARNDIQKVLPNY